MTTDEEIWAGDLLERRREAKRLIGFMESVYARSTAREDASAYVIAVDGKYGQGKTYFLHKLRNQLAITHPVALVDAWADDIADEPFTALAATLRAALGERLKEPEVGKRWEMFKSRAGKVAKLALMGGAKRALGLAVTGGVADQIGDVLGGLSDEAKKAVEDKAVDMAGDSVDDSLEALRSLQPSKLLDNEIDAFEARKQAVKSMKDSLAALVDALKGSGLSPPVFIIIDELDRCRPTYAVKLLEEVKHLFDVEGLVFVFGLHGDQLAHSIAGAYGPGFEGAAYLRRFFHRRFMLAEAPLENLVRKLVDQAQLPRDKLPGGEIQLGGRTKEVPIEELIALYMRMYGLAARDAFEIVDRLMVCTSLVTRPIVAALLIPMICNDIKGRGYFHLDPELDQPGWTFPYQDSRGTRLQRGPQQAFAGLIAATRMSKRDLEIQARQEDVLAVAVWQNYGSVCDFDRLQNYELLLETVAQFKNPKLDVHQGEVAADSPDVGVGSPTP